MNNISVKQEILSNEDENNNKDNHVTNENIESNEPNEINCLCGLKEIEDTFYILCDMCNKWSHSKCYKMTKQQANSTSEWFCNPCEDFNQGIFGNHQQHSCDNSTQDVQMSNANDCDLDISQSSTVVLNEKTEHLTLNDIKPNGNTNSKYAHSLEERDEEDNKKCIG